MQKALLESRVSASGSQGNIETFFNIGSDSVIGRTAQYCD